MDDINKIIERVQQLLMQTWNETGYGSLIIDSERIQGNKIRVIVRGGIFYRYIIAAPEPKIGRDI